MPADQKTLVRYETDEKVGIITLVRADKLNAINSVMKDQIIAAFARADGPALRQGTAEEGGKVNRVRW